MSERAYTVKELDALRNVVEHKWIWGRYSSESLNRWETMRGSHTIAGRAYKEAEKYIAVEQLVRTHMLAGHTAEDLLASEQDA